MKKKYSISLLVAAIIGTLYMLFLIVNFGGAIASSTDAAEQAGVAIATALVTPHMILVTIALIFNWLAYFTNKRGFALTAGILYSVGVVVFLLYIFFVVPSLVLSFVGYIKLKNINEENSKISEK